MKRQKSVLLMLAAALAMPTWAAGWGARGHEAINRTAAEKASAEMPPFLAKNADRLAWLGPEPDRWRGIQEQPLNDAQAPDHFINMEDLYWLKQFPPDRYQFIEAVNNYRERHPRAGVPPPEKIGFQPYITIEIFDRLQVAFRQYRQARARHEPVANAEADSIFYAGWLGHYVADGSNPMHTSIQCNGWVGADPEGFTRSHDVHSKMETVFVNRNPEVTRFAQLVGKPVYLKHPFEDYIAYLRKSQSEIEFTYALEKAGGFDGEGTAEGREFIRRQLARGAQMLLNLWYTAWVDSDGHAELRPEYRR